MISPKEKAKELFDKFMSIGVCNIYDGAVVKAMQDTSRQCALVCVDEILALGYTPKEPSSFRVYQYYCKVKEEINKL